MGDGYLRIPKSWFILLGNMPANVLSAYIDKFRYNMLRSDNFNGLFYYTAEDISNDLGLSPYQIRETKKWLEELDIIDLYFEGRPPKEWIKINMENVQILTTLNLKKLEGLSFKKLKGYRSSFLKDYLLYNKNTYNKNTVSRRVNLRGIEDEGKDGKNDIKERNKVFLPLAKKLSEIIRSIRNIKHTPDQIRAWTNEIRKLSENNCIEYDRIMKALEWYAQNIGLQYTPVIESGNALRKKFERLEAAIQRETEKPMKRIHGRAEKDQGKKKYKPVRKLTS